MSPENENPQIQYGFRLNSITPDFLNSVVKIYENTVGKTYGSSRFAQQLVFEIENIKADLETTRHHERRLGSRLNDHSKLVIRMDPKAGLFRLDFSPNLDSQENKTEHIAREADRMTKEFRSKTNEFLQSSGQGIEIKN